MNLNLNSGYKRLYRAKLVDENLEATGPTNYFREFSNTSDIKVAVSMPFFSGCGVINVPVNNHGIFEFNMTVLNYTIPYLMKIKADKGNSSSIVFDYFVGGFPRSTSVEMGTYSFYTPDNLNHNVTGRLFEAFTNKTFEEDYTLSIY